MSSRWRHALCAECWDAREPNRVAVRVRLDAGSEAGPLEVCCACQRVTVSGIYIRAEPSELGCQGIHPQ